MRHRKAQPDPLFFRCKERVEDVVDFVGRNSAAGVSDVELNRRFDKRGLHAKRSARFHCMNGIKEKVDKGLIQLLSVRVDNMLSSAQIYLQSNAALRQLLLNQTQRIFKGLVKRDGLERGFGRTREIEQAVHDGINSLHLLTDQLKKGFLEILIVMLVREQLREGFNGNERIFNFVGHTRRKRSDA